MAKRLLREMVRIGAQRENPLLPGMDEELRKRLIEQEIRSRLGDPTIRWITDSTNRVQAHCDFCGNYASPEIGCISCRSGNGPPRISPEEAIRITACLLYTSDAADDLLCVDIGGRPIIKKKKNNTTQYSYKSQSVSTTSMQALR